MVDIEIKTWQCVCATLGQLKDRLRRLEHYGDLSVHPSEASRRCEDLRYVIFDTGGMESIDARYICLFMQAEEEH